MTSPQFIHLRLHSEFSIADGLVRIDELVDAALADRQPAVALTDLANLFGKVKFYKRRAARVSSLSWVATSGLPMKMTATNHSVSCCW